MSIVFTEDHGAARHVVLNRPEKRNAMNQELLRALREALREAAADEAVHCVVLRGEGPVFSAGVDLNELGASTGRSGMLRPFREVFLDCANLCEEMAKPVVCQIQRACLGGALEVALGCDLRIASSDSQLGLPEVRFGIIPDVGGSTRLPAVVGLGRAKELIMTARTIDAPEAERIGLVNRVVAAHELAQATSALVDELLANSHLAVGRAKRVIDASARPALAQTLEMEIAVQEFLVGAARAAAAAARGGADSPLAPQPHAATPVEHSPAPASAQASPPSAPARPSPYSAPASPQASPPSAPSRPSPYSAPASPQASPPSAPARPSPFSAPPSPTAPSEPASPMPRSPAATPTAPVPAATAAPASGDGEGEANGERSLQHERRRYVTS